jgi:peptide/nickel transport system substrate-binding protein
MLGSGDVDYMDPNLSYYSIGYLALRAWSRQPYTYPADPQNSTKAVPDLATDMPTVTNDGKTVTITIRQGAQWDTSPPRQVTAADEIRGIKRTCNPAQPFGGLPDYEDLIVGFQAFCDGFAKVPQTASAIAGYLNSHDVAGMKVGSDDRTVVFTLTHPAAYFADMLTLTAFSPAPKEYDAYVPASAQLAQHTISDGPYKIQSYDPTKQIVMVRNPAWNASSDPVRKAYVDKIVINETVTQESTQQQLQTGTASADMEFDNFPPPSQLPSLMSSEDPNFSLGPSASSNPYIVFNMISPSNGGAMSKPAFRQALMYGINRQHIIQALGGPKVNPPLTHILPSDLVGGTPDTDPYPYNMAKAKQLIAQAGYPKGVTLKFLYRNASEGSSKTFATVQQDLKPLGITVVGVPVPNADFYTKYLQVPSVAKRGVWDLSLAGWGADWYGNGALSFFNPLFSGRPSFPPQGSNYSFYASATTDRLISEAISATTEDQAAQLWHRADQQVMADAPIFPITQPNQPNYHAKQVHNAVYLPSLQNYDPTNVWLDPATNGD